MTRRRLIIFVVLFLAWVAFAAWQYNEYSNRSRLAREIPDRQSHSVMNALVGGIRSHCRLGRFIREQLQGVLDELVAADDVVAVAISDDKGRIIISAGDLSTIPAGPPQAGHHWRETDFLLTEPFSLSSVGLYCANCSGCSYLQNSGFDAGLVQTHTPGRGLGPGLGLGRGRETGRGRGLGPGMGLGRTWLFDDAREESSSLCGDIFHATLVLDRRPFDALCRMAFWEFIGAIAGGAVVMVCVAAAWLATVRLTEARGRTEVLETEARHLRELGQAAAGLAHETRNPLGLVRGWTQQLAQSALKTPADSAHAQAVIEECDRITARINQFLAYAKPCKPSLAEVRVREVVDELATLLQPDLEARRVALEVRADDLTVRADREMLRQILFNLLQNAISFSPTGATVEVTARQCLNGGRNDAAWKIEVADRGPGVPADQVGSLFLPYSTTRPDGTGLGLAIVARIAAAHAWEVKYHHRQGGGAVFSLCSSLREKRKEVDP